MREKASPEQAIGLDRLKAAHAEALSQLNEYNAALLEAQRRVARAEEKERALFRLLAIESEEATTASTKSRQATRPPGLLDACEAILAEHGGQMRLAELREEVTRRGIPLPGRGTDANLLGRLQHSGGRIVRVSRGVYGLPDRNDAPS